MRTPGTTIILPPIPLLEVRSRQSCRLTFASLVSCPKCLIPSSSVESRAPYDYDQFEGSLAGPPPRIIPLNLGQPLYYKCLNATPQSSFSIFLDPYNMILIVIRPRSTESNVPALGSSLLRPLAKGCLTFGENAFTYGAHTRIPQRGL